MFRRRGRALGAGASEATAASRGRRIAAGIIWDVEGEQPEMFIRLAVDVAKLFWPDGQRGLKWNRAALKRILKEKG